MNSVDYEGRMVHPVFLLTVLIFSFLAIWLGQGAISLMNEKGPYVIIVPIILGIMAIMGWLNFLFRKIVVEEDGITHKRTHTFNLPFYYSYDFLYAFEDIEEIKVRGNLVNIKSKPQMLSLGWILIQNPTQFIEAVKRHAPEKLG